MERIFVTGATGFIGSRLVRELASREEVAEVLALYRSKIPFTQEKIRWVKGDMDHLPTLAYEELPTKVIHCAALMERGVKPKDVYESNTRWTENVIGFCKRNKVKEIVQFSTINVNLKHQGTYARSKQACEKLVRESGLKYKIVRPTLVYGRGKNGLGSLMGYIQHLPAVPVFGNGHAKEQPIYVEDLAKLAASYALDEEGPEMLELGGKEPMEYDEMVQIMAASIGKRARIVHLPFAPFYHALSLLEKLNLPLPISSEQVAHIAEDLDTNMGPVCERYHIELADFADKVRECM